MAKIDILLPFWGDVELFKKTVRSVLSQTERDWKLLIFDDCYPSGEPAKFISELKDSRISYHRHEKNIGITPNFNFALSKAKAPYFMMLGCDDILLPNYIKTALGDIKSADFYQPSIQVIDQNGSVYTPLVDKVKSFITPKPGTHKGEPLAVSLCNGNWLYFPSILWKTDIIKRYGFDNNYKIAEDLILELQLILDGHTLRVGSVPAFQYRRFSQSLSSREKSKGGVRFDEEEMVYNRFFNEFKAKGWHKAALSAKIRLTSRIHRIIS